MKVREPFRMTVAQKKAMDQEIRRAVAEENKTYSHYFDALLLWVLHEELGLGKKRLRLFYDAFRAKHYQFIKDYQIDSGSGFVAEYKLSGIGVDLKAWEKEAGIQ